MIWCREDSSESIHKEPISVLKLSSWEAEIWKEKLQTQRYQEDKLTQEQLKVFLRLLQKSNRKWNQWEDE